MIIPNIKLYAFSMLKDLLKNLSFSICGLPQYFLKLTQIN